MKVSDHLDKISSLGFEIILDWNSEFGIYYNANDVIPATAYSVLVLRCSYYKSKHSYTFVDMVECCCDVFYAWYNKNIDVIRNFDTNYDRDSMSKLEDVSRGDITKQVDRELNITDILEKLNVCENKKSSE